jgi:predicted glycosyltransferase involved in capsule biosynthesis
MFKRNVFEAGGKGNTKFIGWGFEDDEIFVRFSKLGYKIIRLDNPLFHMEHTRTSNLDGKSKYYLNNKEIYDNIRAMSREEILEEINNWK